MRVALSSRLATHLDSTLIKALARVHRSKRMLDVDGGDKPSQWSAGVVLSAAG